MDQKRNYSNIIINFFVSFVTIKKCVYSKGRAYYIYHLFALSGTD